MGQVRGEGDPCLMPCHGSGGFPGWRVISIQISDLFSIGNDASALPALSLRGWFKPSESV